MWVGAVNRGLKEVGEGLMPTRYGHNLISTIHNMIRIDIQRDKW